ncbi:p-loop containing nucleoside triphosphate hydrolase [Diplodia corticola]|uniref:ubiquitinyl hydrolase 1 n=1 Tax=Diplodia corticola TaxID=236234 RepID=A0A1J9RUS3_9PEZI|nr:p-loop containing nucleoside triphosphate hydrolase [Diplodia corticola]OJD31253.1 p-loop containing nucleoside triphosphate hydrolase [Diplodia corticola]
MSSAAHLLEAQFNHIVLPAQLPSIRDEDLTHIQTAITDRLIGACRLLRESTTVNDYFDWDNLTRALNAVKTLNFNSKIDKQPLIQELRELKPDAFLILHIGEQNAGLLIRRIYSNHGHEVVFEAFEASPRSEDVLATQAALEWDFPGSAVAVPHSTFANHDFQDSLAGFLAQCSVESINSFAARAYKARSSTVEIRDTTDPAMISSLLMTVLEAHGRRFATPLLRKRVRDDVCWGRGAEVPWRRLPFWLVLRVGLARYLAIKHGGEVGRLRYKFLMCAALAQLLQDALCYLDLQNITTLRAKLARRLAKLEMAKVRASPETRIHYDLAFASLNSTFQTALQEANQHVVDAWEDLKRGIKRPIKPLPRYANADNLTLALPRSRPTLHHILRNPELMDQRPMGPYKFNMNAANQNMRPLAKRCMSLSRFELEVEQASAIDQSLPLGKICIEACGNINDYFDMVSSTYDGNPEQMSIMILTIMQLWVTLDRAATDMYGLLLAFSPGMSPDALDVLQLPRFSDMKRLQDIQSWLRFRQEKSKFTNRTMFDYPDSGCFSDRFYNESDTLGLHELRERIEHASEEARAAKEQEFITLSQEYEKLQQRIAETSCAFFDDGFLREHDDRGCAKCFLQRRARKMFIGAHEHFLPEDSVQANAVVFELGCGPVLAAYRDATWRILGTLARSHLTQRPEPRLLIQKYGPLEQFVGPYAPGITLASKTKSFLGTHYRNVYFPATLDIVCLRNPLRFEYFDSATMSWPGSEQGTPAFAHHCQVKIPSESPFSSLLSQLPFAPDGKGPQSNEIIASQTRCPRGLSSHEYMAFQSLFSGKHCRWPVILLELASSNMNFGAEGASLAVSQLSSQAGPAHGNDPLRTIHQVFRDASFCERLLDQIRTRVEMTSTNWRETNSMGMLITLLLRLIALGCQESARDALVLLDQVRHVTHSWICQLRSEIQKATDAESSRRCSRYAIWAALLCRRTFSPYCEDSHHETLSSAVLQFFVESSITLQDNMISDPETLPTVLQHALMRDLKMSHRLKSLVRRSIEENPEGLITAIDNIWQSVPGSTLRTCSDVEFLDGFDEWTAQLTFVGGEQSRRQTVHYDILEGHLLIDNQPLGRLPTEHRNSLVLRELFGQQNLLIYPSELYGMEYKLAFPENGHQIHIGFRNEKLIIRARKWDRELGERILEHIPRSTFFHKTEYDLPAALVDNCVHWLDLTNGLLDIRPVSDKWRRRPGDWCINMKTHIASRRGSRLVDPHSQLFRQVAAMFEYFEHPQALTVYQPRSSPLSVELRRLELAFFVNRRRCLQCRELRAEIDPDQDAGTWYGLNSKLVLRDPVNVQNRSVIVPLGPLSYHRNKFHVAVKVLPNGKYAKYAINTVLGRLDCPAEPWLLYFRAQLHAFTSAILPDPLTGRTGTEEALHLLRSGSCQPWTPLQQGPLSCLLSIASIPPNREYYPEGLQKMQTVHWNVDLPITIQRDEFLPLVETIYRRSCELRKFIDATAEDPPFREIDPHLLRRSINHRQLHERTSDGGVEQLSSSDNTYVARDRLHHTNRRQNVFDAVKLLTRWSPRLPTTARLGSILQQWPVIQGHGQTFDRILLSDQLDLQFGHHWGSLVDFCRRASHDQVYSLSFMLGTLSFKHNANMEVVRTLVAFAISERLKRLEPPKWLSYSQFHKGDIPTVAYLVGLIRPFASAYTDIHRSESDARYSGKIRRKLQLEREAHEDKVEKQCEAFANILFEQWPCAEPTLAELSLESFPLLRAAQAFEIIKPEWLRLFQNFELYHYVKQVQEILDHNKAHVSTQMEFPSEDAQVFSLGHRGDEIPSLSKDLLRKSVRPTPKRKLDELTSSPRIAESSFESPQSFRAGNEDIHRALEHPQQAEKSSRTVQEVADLEQIVEALSKSASTVRQQYARDLKQSIDSLKSLSIDTLQPNDATLQIHLVAATLQARQQMQDRLDSVLCSLERDDPRAKWLKAGGLWPCATTVTLLEQIRSISSTAFGPGMKESLVEFAISITHLQRALRLQDASLKDKKERLEEEQAHSGHTNWQPLRNTDWLLLEIDSNILIRPGQVDVALATISPGSGANSVLQMNMGQGKTSCIIPMVAAALADTKKLVRIIVPNALLLQTAQLLHGRLGGLLGRQIRHVPYSRKTQTVPEVTAAFWQIHKEVMRDAGIMIALPEHTMSFMLSGLQRLSDNRIPEAAPMVKVQAWMRKVCRDVLDESDFTLAVRTQLIYPSGQQTSVDGHPHRWETAEALLKLVETHIWNLHRDFPRSIEVITRSAGGFPLFFLLRKDVEQALITHIVDDVVGGKTPILPCQDCPATDRQVIRRYLTDSSVDQATLDRVKKMFTDTPIARQNLHHMRGLLVHRLLLLTLKKRWSVEYGLHPTRDPIAVPYHAKGVPSDQAEWGHPDVAILFTCLSFYYQGLSLSQMQQCLESVVKSDDPSAEYDGWMHSGPNIPGSLREWNVINVDDETQLHELWQHLRYSIVVANYCLNHFVFPTHAKQFKIKLQSSGWDIPLMTSPDGMPSRHKPLTTGFSGTNDNRTMLPLTIRQQDLPGLSHTNAEVITYLLQRRNRRYILAADERGRRIPEMTFLQNLRTLGICILIDAGAQILEMDNFTLAKSWLRIDTKAKAALFFKENRPFILYRNGTLVPLLASPFAEDLSECLIYLDEAHTRGTDLKMPIDAVGALTLGLGQTKDHTVQAAMRLRQLATTQSVVFFATPEVHQNILDQRHADQQGKPVDSYDVVCWLLEQTCAGLEQLQPLYYSQGVDFCRRSQAQIDNPDILTNMAQRQNYLKELRQVEHQTLEQMYKPKTKAKASNPSWSFSPQLASLMKELDIRRKGFQDDGNAVHASALQEVEQEREVANEVESVREVQKPVIFSPIKFSSLHKDIASFAKSGRLVSGSFGYEHMFMCLRGTALGCKHRINSKIITSRLFVSREFAKTVELRRQNDNFLRQVSWVLWSTETDTAMVVVPEEVELLIPLLRESKKPVTHLLSYAPPVTRKMTHFNDLTYYSIPPMPRDWTAPAWLRTELGLFAGRLYFEYDEYAGMMKYLGLSQDDDDDNDDDEPAGPVDEPTQPAGRGDDGKESDGVVRTKAAHAAVPFTAKPLTFIREWLAARRKGQDFAHTPMGFVCQGKPLAADHPFFAKAVDGPVLPAALGQVRGGNGSVGAAAEDDEDDDFDDAEEDLWFDADEDGILEEGEGGEMDVDEGEKGVHGDVDMAE